MTGYDVRTISLAGIPGAAAITALALGADGNVYAGLTGDGHVLARISAADDRVEDLGRIFPERRGMAPVLDKIHNSLVPGPDGALYLGQGLNIDWNAAPRGCDLAAYGGGHLFRFDPGTGRLDDLGVPVPLNAIHGMAMDPARRILYGYTIPDNHFFVHRLDDRVSTDLGKIGSYASHNLVVGKNGTVYGGFFGDVGFTGGASEPERKIRHSGTYLFRCRPDDGRLQRTTEMVVYGDEHDIFSNKGIDAWTVASDGTIYGGTAVGGFVFTVDEDTGRVAAIGRRLGHDDLAITGQRQPARALALVVQRDAPDFNVIIGGDSDFHRQRDLVIGAPEFGLMRIEADVTGRGRYADGLVRGRP